MKHIGLFDGIGGFSYASALMGWETIAICEINKFCQQVLKYHFSDAIQHEDITTTDFTIYRNRCDIVTGGFPCQPFSHAGKRKGTMDERYMWKEMYRAVQEIAPNWVICENVRGILNWDGGLVFDQINTDLENIGYETSSFILPAIGCNAPHKRERFFLVAHTSSKLTQRGIIRKQGKTKGSQGRNVTSRCPLTICNETPSIDNTNIARNDKQYVPTKSAKKKKSSGAITPPRDFAGFPTESPICGRNDGIPKKLDNITISKWKAETLKAYGNAIVPAVILQLYKAIELYELNEKCPI